ncbi:MAG: ferritin family protein [Planctomycetes bacterium]|nr:ferritin family protein [Planctomycetota bacterium]
MTIALNAFEVFEIAEQIERNGAKFYRKAAELLNEPDIRNMFLELADWETRHEQIFNDMGKQLPKPSKKSKFLGLEKKLLDPKLMASLAVFGTGSEPVHRLRSVENISEVLKTAIEKEKDSITFYEGLKDFVSDRDGKNKIDDIIEEEMHHIKILNQALKQRE